jgi:hypothetical protein
MKQNYTLEIYDTLFNEIKHFRKTNEKEVISFLKQCGEESHYLHEVIFSKNEGLVKYSIKDKVHNLHLKAPDFFPTNCSIDSDFEKYIPSILRDLNIQNTTATFCWSSYHENNILIICEQCPIEELTPENLLFLFCCQKLKQENNKIIKINKERVFSLKSKGKIEHYIQRKQQALENLSHRLIREINPIVAIEIYQFSSEYNKSDCLKVVYIYLEKLLQFIEIEYLQYLDIEIQVPFKTLLIKELEIDSKIYFVKNQLLEMNLDNQLLKIAYQPLLKIATLNINQQITYNEFNYYSNYIAQFYNYFNESNQNYNQDKIIEWLFDLNLNNHEFFDFSTDLIQKTLNFENTTNDKINKLYQLLKYHNQRQTRNFMKLRQKLPSIKNQIINWIEEEIEYLNKKNSIEKSKSFQVIHKEESEKISTNLSVAQLSYFFGLLSQNGILKPKSQSELFRFIAANFKTKSTTTISESSIKNKFYNVETTTVNKVCEKLIEIINLTKL